MLSGHSADERSASELTGVQYEQKAVLYLAFRQIYEHLIRENESNVRLWICGAFVDSPGLLQIDGPYRILLLGI